MRYVVTVILEVDSGSQADAIHMQIVDLADVDDAFVSVEMRRTA